MKQIMKIIGVLGIAGVAFGLLVWLMIKWSPNFENRDQPAPPPGTIMSPEEAQLHNMSAPDDEHVEGYMDSTDLGFATVLYYEINTPDGQVPCLVVETRQLSSEVPALDCDWTVIR